MTRDDAIERLLVSRGPFVSIDAPAGYGKTTLARQWVERDPRRTTWIDVDERTDIAHACAPLAGDPDPVLVVLDAIERLPAAGWPAVRKLLDVVAPGSTIALVGRRAPGPLAKLRAAGLVSELGIDDLRMDADDVAELTRARGATVGPEGVESILKRTEGWPVAVALEVVAGPDARPLEDYVDTELLSALTRAQRGFLEKCSVLDWISSELCDVAIPTKTSGRTIRALETSSLPLFPMEGRRWRLHPVVRDVLRADLDAADSEAVIPIARRGSQWCEEHGYLGSAISFAQTAGDIDRVADLTVRSALVGSWASSMPTIHVRLRWIADRVPLEHYPFAAAIGAWIHINTGNATVADRLAAAAARGPLDAIGPDGSPLRAWISLLRATLAHDGVERSRADAMWALEELAPGSPWRAPAWLVFGFGCAVMGDWEEADAALADAAEGAAEDGAVLARAMALGEQALVAIELDRWAQAASLATEGYELLADEGPDASWGAAVARVAAARVALHDGDVETAREHLEFASEALVHLTRAIPGVSVQVRLVAAKAYLAIGDTDRTAAMLDEADSVLRRSPKMQELADLAAETREQLHRRTDGAVRLTKAEYRLLPLLATHMTLQAIADELYLSPHTVKAEAISIYRKLGQTSRGATIARAREIGLIGS